MPRVALRDRWLDLCHRLPPFRGRLAIGRWVGRTFLSNPRNRVTFAPLSNGYRVKIDLGWADAYDSLYYFRTGYEPDLTRLIRAVVDAPGANFIDVGANVGIFSIAVADILRRHGGRALAIEPIPANFRMLKESLDANALTDVIDAKQRAVGDHEGALVLSQLSYGETANAIPLAWGAGGTTDRDILRWNDPAQQSAGLSLVEARMVTLDQLTAECGFESAAMVKIDVEGAELFVLRGAVRLLRQARPIVYAEFHQPLMAANGTTFEAIAEFCAGVRYEIWFLDKRLTKTRPSPNARFLNAVLVPDDPSTHQRHVIAQLSS